MESRSSCVCTLCVLDLALCHPAYSQHVESLLFLQILQAISGALSARLYELITDSSGSHVVRRLLTVAAGFDVTPDKAPINGADAAGVHDTGKVCQLSTQNSMPTRPASIYS